jgi:WD repeat-containing protein 48
MEGSADVSEGECVVICRESELQEDVGGGEYMGDRGYEGINKIVAMDDTFVWTATGSSSIKRWRDPGRRATRAENAEKSPMPVGLLPTESASRHNSLGLLSGTPILRSNDSSQDSFLGDDTVVLPSNKIDTTSTIPISSGPSFSSIYKRDSLRSDTLLSPPGTHPEATLFQIPFASLVRLASFNDPYSRNPTIVTTSRARDSEVATLYSAASVRSVPITRHFPPSRPTAQALHSAMRQQTIGSDTLGVSTPSPPAGAAGPPRFVFPPDGAADVYSPSARAEYEEREIAADAIPLRLQPDEIILGSHGLVRSIILNDRMHALTVDTAGEVAIWDLIRGTCIGVFAKEDVENASNEGSGSKGTGAGSNGLAFGRSPREALESVRERIEGEGMVAAWSTVDTRIGDLTVHMLDQRCFEAEVYMDEAGLSDMKGFQEEQRGMSTSSFLSFTYEITFSERREVDPKQLIRRYVLFAKFEFVHQLTILRAGFVQAELRQNASTAVPTPAVPPTPSTGIRRGPAPSHINFESTGGASSRRPRTLSDIGTWTARTPGIAISLNTPSMTPAVLPELPPPSPTVSRQAPKEHGLSTIPHSPVVPGSPPPMPSISAVPSSFPTKTPSAKDTNEPDYFSLRVNPKKSFHGRSLTDTDDAANHNHNGAQKGPAAQELQTPGGGFMGRLRNFGKNKRAAASESGAPTPAPIPEGDEKRSEDKIVNPFILS